MKINLNKIKKNEDNIKTRKLWINGYIVYYSLYSSKIVLTTFTVFLMEIFDL